MKQVTKAVILFFGISSQGFSGAMEDAEQLFSRRGEGVSVIDQARKAYEGLLPGVSGKDQVRATLQVARLDAYEANLMDRSERKKRTEILTHCINTLENYLNPQKVGKKIEFLYWRAACEAMRGEVSLEVNDLTALDGLPKLLGLLTDGRAMEQGNLYEGGGFDRIEGAIWLRLPKFNSVNPQYVRNLKKAEELLKKSKNSASHPSQDQEFDTGDYFFETHWLLAETLAATRDDAKEQEALTLIDESIGRIDDKDQSSIRVPEDNIAKSRMQALKKNLSE